MPKIVTQKWFLFLVFFFLLLGGYIYISKRQQYSPEYMTKKECTEKARAVVRALGLKNSNDNDYNVLLKTCMREKGYGE